MKIEGSWYKELKQSEAVGSFWTRGTKVNVGLALFVVSILTLGYVGGSGYLGYSDSDGSTAWTSTDQTFITTSNGNRYNATSAGLQSALAVGGYIQCPEMNVTVTSALQVHSGTTLKGMGNRTILYLAASAADNYDIMNITTGSNNILIERIKFDMNEPGVSGSYVCGIYLKTYTKNVTVRDCYFTRIEWYGIDQASSSTVSNLTVEGCYFDRAKQSGYGGAIAFRGKDNIARNNRIYNLYATGIVMEGGFFTLRNIIDGNIITGPVSVGIYSEATGKSSGSIIVNNIVSNINNTAYSGSPDGIGILATNNCTVSNNFVNNAARGGIKIDGDNATVSANVINEIGYGYTGGFGINGGSNSIITGNKIRNQLTGTASRPTYGITFGDMCVITNNHLYAGGVANFDIGLYNAGGGNCTISNNYIEGATTGLRLDGRYAIISSNVFYDAAASNNAAIFINSGKYSTISCNSLQSVDRGIRLYKSTNCTVTGNIIDANDATYGIYEDTAPCDFNTITFNNMLLSNTPATSITILTASGNSSSLFNRGCYKTMWTHLMANPVAGAQYVNATTGDICTYTGAAWVWNP